VELLCHITKISVYKNLIKFYFQNKKSKFYLYILQLILLTTYLLLHKPTFMINRTRIISVLFFFLLHLTTYSQKAEKYSRVKVTANEVQFKNLLSKGIAFDELAEKTNSSFTGDFSASEIAIFKASKLKTEIIIDDLAADFLKRNEKSRAEMKMQGANLRTGGTPTGFNYGSMGGYLTYNEMVAELDEMRTNYPNLITVKQNIGNSREGRAIWMVKISDNGAVNDPEEPGVVYSGLHHSREPMSMMNLIYFMHYILSNYNTDPEIKCLIDENELYFIPCVNPDGYVYNQTTNPDGGGYWRKNRRNNGDATFGVDLNRNYNYFWGYDNEGSSPVTSSEVYRGPSANSEPEVTAFSNFVNSIRPQIAINYHSYSNEMVMPMGYANLPVSLEFHYRSVASMLTFENKFPYGRPYELLGYNANGNSDDWMSGVANVSAYSPEVGSEADGFWPVQSKIIPICESVLEMNISAAWASGKYIKPSIAANTYISGGSYNLPILLTNYGNTAGTTETAQLSINDSRVTFYDNSIISANGLAVDSTKTALKNITFATNAASGIINANLVTKNNVGCVYNIPVSFMYSGNGCYPIPASWTAVDIGSPGLAGSSCLQSGVYTLKGAGTGLTTSSDKYHMMKLTANSEVTEFRARTLSVQNTASGARAGITIAETAAAGSKRVTLVANPSTGKIDYQLRSSTNGSIKTISVTSTTPKWLRILKVNNSYSGFYSTNGIQWTLIGSHKVTLITNRTAGLVVTSGSSTVLNTATFDSLILTTPTGIINRSITSVNNEIEINDIDENNFSVYPNPSKGYLDIRLPVSNEKQSIKIYDFNGKQVYQESSIQNSKTLNLNHLSNGLYFIQYSEGTKMSYKKFVINK